VTFVDTPGLVDGDMQYPFDVNEAIVWLGKPLSCMGVTSVSLTFKPLICKVICHFAGSFKFFTIAVYVI
jgi:hypothetical protein